MIPEAAVEAVALILAEARCADIDRDAGYGDGDNLAPDDYAIFMPDARENARNLLEAAAPHMLAEVVALADGWEADGEEIMALSKRTPDEREATMCLMEGATMVENARLIRNAMKLAP